VTPLSPSTTRELLAQLGHQPKRFLGQNFLVDGNIVRKSLELAEVRAGDAVVEIGPGLGTLTSALLAAGADALSVLTDEKYFGGTLEDLRGVTTYFQATAPAIACLRKDFMIHPIQVLRARGAGASAILIIVRALTDEEITVLAAAAAAAGLDALYEIHTEAEIARAVAHGARIIGVNNRDLASFKTDLALSERLIPLFPREVIAVSESGISTAADAARVRTAGAHAVLVGEALMRAADPAALVAGFRSA
jgi:indole-3-glycerol phosphate synthase